MWRKQNPILQSAPSFVQGLSNVGEIEEGQFLHLEAKVEPLGDNTLRVYWRKYPIFSLLR
jgi:hypothetical protein